MINPVAGTYALILEARDACKIRVGCLGRVCLFPGWYVYVGSAFGPGGLRARCAHHLRTPRRPHWHVDYLRTATLVREIWFTQDPSLREHEWAEQMLRARGASAPFAGFGATDCGCLSHLSFHHQFPSLGAFRQRLHRHCPGHFSVRRYAPIVALTH